MWWQTSKILKVCSFFLIHGVLGLIKGEDQRWTSPSLIFTCLDSPSFQIFQVFLVFSDLSSFLGVLSLADRKILLVLAASELLCEEAWRSSSACRVSLNDSVDRSEAVDVLLKRCRRFKR
jgi:hypothetical protein